MTTTTMESHSRRGRAGQAVDSEYLTIHSNLALSAKAFARAKCFRSYPATYTLPTRVLNHAPHLDARLSLGYLINVFDRPPQTSSVSKASAGRKLTTKAGSLTSHRSIQLPYSTTIRFTASSLEKHSDHFFRSIRYVSLFL